MKKIEECSSSHPPFELETQAIFHIGDTTIIAAAHYQEKGRSCTESIINILVEEVNKE